MAKLFPKPETAANIEADLQTVFERAIRSVVVIRAGRHSSGSGIVWKDGTVVTNAHVARRKRLQIEGWGGVAFEGQVRQTWPERDLAAIDIPKGQLMPAPIGDSTALRVGEIVLCIGNPLVAPNSLVMGPVHSIARPTDPERTSVIQADVALEPGYSGGPMLSAQGDVVGVNSMVAGGLAVAITEYEVERSLQALAAPKLGIRVQPIVVNPAGAQGQVGLLVVDVVSGSPADGRIQFGDIVLTLNGVGTTSAAALRSELAKAGAGLDAKILRAGAEITFSIDLVADPTNRKGAKRAA